MDIEDHLEMMEDGEVRELNEVCLTSARKIVDFQLILVFTRVFFS